MQVSPLGLLMGNRSVKGWYSGTSIDIQDTLAFSARQNVRSMNEVYRLERVTEAYEQMMSGRAKFLCCRGVLTKHVLQQLELRSAAQPEKVGISCD